jgi:hypothetical protein
MAIKSHEFSVARSAGFEKLKNQGHLLFQLIDRTAFLFTIHQFKHLQSIYLVTRHDRDVEHVGGIFLDQSITVRERDAACAYESTVLRHA